MLNCQLHFSSVGDTVCFVISTAKDRAVGYWGAVKYLLIGIIHSRRYFIVLNVVVFSDNLTVVDVGHDMGVIKLQYTRVAKTDLVESLRQDMRVSFIEANALW